MAEETRLEAEAEAKAKEATAAAGRCVSFGDPQAVGRVEMSTPPAPPGTPPYVLTPVPAEESEVEEASPEGPQVLIELHRTSKVQGKQVTEYCVLATWHRSYMSWHRYTDFKVLHDSLAPTLDLGPFPVPAFPIFNDQHKDGRARELQACLRACIAASVSETTLCKTAARGDTRAVLASLHQAACSLAPNGTAHPPVHAHDTVNERETVAVVC